jgi:hypothetical protein
MLEQAKGRSNSKGRGKPPAKSTGATAKPAAGKPQKKAVVPPNDEIEEISSEETESVPSTAPSTARGKSGGRTMKSTAKPQPAATGKTQSSPKKGKGRGRGKAARGRGKSKPLGDYFDKAAEEPEEDDDVILVEEDQMHAEPEHVSEEELEGEAASQLTQDRDAMEKYLAEYREEKEKNTRNNEVIKRLAKDPSLMDEGEFIKVCGLIVLLALFGYLFFIFY